MIEPGFRPAEIIPYDQRVSRSTHHLPDRADVHPERVVVAQLDAFSDDYATVGQPHHIVNLVQQVCRITAHGANRHGGGLAAAPFRQLARVPGRFAAALTRGEKREGGAEEDQETKPDGEAAGRGRGEPRI